MVSHPGTGEDKPKLLGAHCSESLFVTVTAYCTALPAYALGFAGDKLTVGDASVQTAGPYATLTFSPVEDALSVAIETLV